MSTTSCPRCSALVTLPVGVSNETTVRCPLCHAHYTLADAFVNMPPLLEVVEPEADDISTKWDDSPEGSEAETLELGSLELGDLEVDTDGPLAAAELEKDADDDLEFGEVGLDETVEADQTLAALTPPQAQQPIAEDGDDLLDFDAPLATPADESEPAEEAEPAEEEFAALDFGEEELSLKPPAAEAAETIELGAGGLNFDEPDSEEVKFDLDGADLDSAGDDAGAATLDVGGSLDEPAPVFEAAGADPAAADDEVKFDFGEPDAGAETVQFNAGDDDMLDFGAETVGGSDEGLRDFEDLKVDASGDPGEISFEEPAPAMAVPVAAVEEAASGKKGKKEKKKKEKKVKPPKEPRAAGDKPRRSLVGMLAGLLLAIPAALYGVLWLGPDYDFVGLSKFVPSAALPAAFNQKTIARTTFTPPASLPNVPSGPAAEPVADEPAAADPSADVPAEDAAADDAATEHTTARPPAETGDAPAADAAEAPADEAPSLTEPAAEAPAEAMPSETPAAAEDDLFAPSSDAEVEPAPADNAIGAPAEDDLFAPEPAAEPATEPAADAPADDPFAPAADAESAPAEEMPAEDPFAPAETPAAEPAAAPAEDDLFAPEPAAEEAAPAEPNPADPVADDPFAPAEKPAEMPADDPFAPAADAPAAETPAEDPFAPADAPPEEVTPATRPADPFAPEPAEGDAPPEMPAEDAPLEDVPAEQPEPIAPAPETRPAEPDPFAPAPAEPALAPSTPQPAAQDEPVGLRNAPAASAAEIGQSMQQAFVTGQQLMAAEATGDEAAVRKARAAFYVNLYDMAGRLTAAQNGPQAAAVGPQLQQLAPVLRQQLATDPRRLEALGVFGARWLAFPKRTTDGVVVAGKVESAEQVGRLYHTKARIGSGADAPLVTIVTAKDPQLASGDSVLALGTIVDRPGEQLVGYEGTDPSVVWSGMTMKLGQ